MLFFTIMLIPQINRQKMNPMIVQNTRNIFRKKFNGVIRCFGIGVTNELGKFIALGSQNKKLIIMDPELSILQEIPFSQWVRCISIKDLNNDGNGELVVGSGDNSLRIFQFNGIDYNEIFHFQFDDFVDACVIEDITGDGDYEIIVGSWDKTLKIFSSKDLIFELLKQTNFDYGIQKIMVQDINLNDRKEIILLLKGGGIKVIEGESFEELWEFKISTKINDCAIGILDETEYPMILIGGDDQKLYFFNTFGELICTKIYENRITSLLVDDINNNGLNEIILSTGQDNLMVFEFSDDNVLIENMKLRWKNRIHGVVLHLELNDINNDYKKELLYAGYDCSINAIQDFYYCDGSIPKPIETPLLDEHISISAPNQEIIESSNPILNIDVPSLFYSDDETVKNLETVESQPENDFSNEITGTSIIDEEVSKHPKELYENQEIQPSNEFSSNQQNELPSYKKYNEFKEKDLILSEIAEISHSKNNQKEHFSILEESTKEIKEDDDVISSIFQDTEYYPSKAKLIAAFVSGGLDGTQAIQLFDDLKRKELIIFQRKSPRGYYLVQGEVSKPIIEPSLEPAIMSKTFDSITDIDANDSNDSNELIERAKKIFEDQPYYSTKALLFKSLRDGGIPEVENMPIFEYFKSKMLLHYSKSKPRGYHYVGDKSSEIGLNDVPILNQKKVDISIDTPTNIETTRDSNLSNEIINQIHILFEKQAIYGTKAKLIAAIEIQLPQFELDPVSIFELSKELGIINYNRKSPRGYHLTDSHIGEEINRQKIDIIDSKSTFNKEKIIELFSNQELYSTKASLLNAISEKFNLSLGTAVDSIFNEAKKEKIILYNRSSPRGYKLA